jgi:beta-lactamase regulating signal transducer with metallopeptidase domain
VARMMASCLAFLLGGPYSTILPFLLLPWVCRSIVERIVDHSNLTALSLRWRACLTGFAACMPGLVTLSLLSFSAGCIFHAVPDDFDCHMEMYGPLFIVAVLVCRALAILIRQALTVRRLLASTKPPCSILMQIAEGLNLSLVELPIQVPVCMVLGAWSPRVVVSTGMLDAFSDEELRAALWHEKSHIERGDTRYNVLISFLSDCGVWHVRNALREYKQACEELADHRATREVSSIVLAETLIRFARNSWHLPFAEALANDNDLEARVRRLLDSPASFSSATRVLWPLAFLVFVSSVMVSYPMFARSIALLLTHCL